MKKVLPLLLSLLLSACGTFQVNIQVGSEPTQTQTLLPQATLLPTATATTVPLSPTPFRTSIPTPTRLPSTQTPTPEPTATASPAQSLTPTSTPLPVNIDDPAFPAFPTLTAGQSITLTTIQMMDETTGWGIELEGHIVRTTDGGFTWKMATPPRGRYQPGGLFALNAKVAWATPFNLDALCAQTPSGCPDILPPLRNATVWRTDDGGATWLPGHPFSLGDRDGDASSVVFYNPAALHFLDAQNGWLLVTVNHLMNQDYYRLYRTVDGGDTWSWLTDHQFGPIFCGVYGIGFLDADTGWIAGNCVGLGLMNEQHWGVYQTADGGHTWNWVSLPPPYDLPDGFFQYAYECGVEAVDIIPPDSVGLKISCALRDKASGYSAYHFYYLSLDGSQDWRSWQVKGNVGFLNHESGWQFSPNAAGSFDLERTVDGGQSWTLLKTVWWNGQLDFVSEQVGWVVARIGEETALLKTSDGGQNWAEVKTFAAR